MTLVLYTKFKAYLIGSRVIKDQLMCVQVVAIISRHRFHSLLVTSGQNVHGFFARRKRNQIQDGDSNIERIT